MFHISSSPRAPGQTLSDTVTHDTHLHTLRECWQEALPAFASDGKLSGSHVENLWRGAHFILTVRAARLATLGAAEVEEACNTQLSSFPAYSSAVASVINRVARAYAGADIPRAVNRAYLQIGYNSSSPSGGSISTARSPRRAHRGETSDPHPLPAPGSGPGPRLPPRRPPPHNRRHLPQRWHLGPTHRRRPLTTFRPRLHRHTFPTLAWRHIHTLRRRPTPALPRRTRRKEAG